MNAIYGYLRLDGAPVELEKLEAMHQAMAYWGVDGMAGWSEGSAGLGCQFSICTPEVDRNIPCYDREHGWVMTVGAFLDNREDLLDQFGLNAEMRRSVADTELVRLAYGRWGEECVHHLTGDWHFAVWHIKEQKLFLARDHIGNTGISYIQGLGFFAFGSCKKALLALPDVHKRPNLLRVAQVLTSWPGDGVLTAYEGIHRLPSAHCLTVYKRELKIKRYWFAENSPEIRFLSDEDYIEAFLEQYGRAVRARLRANSPVGSTLSGGLDSGSVSVLAARELAKKGQRLAAYTSVPLMDVSPWAPSGRIGNESALAMATATHAGNIDINWIKAEKVSPLAGIKAALAIHDTPALAASNAFWLTYLLQTAKEHGHRVLLTGQGGNSTVSFRLGPVSLLPLLWPHKWDELMQRFPEIRARQGVTFFRAVRRFFLAPLIVPLRGRLRWGLVAGRNVFLNYSVINPQFAHTLDLYRLMRRAGHDPFFRTVYDPILYRHQLIRMGWSRSLENGGFYSLEMRDPTMDKGLLTFCLGLPETCYEAGGLDRALIRRASKELLPNEVRLNTRRGKQAADICYKIANSLPEIEAALQYLECNALCREVLDLNRMKHLLAATGNVPDPEHHLQSGSILLRGLAVGLFLLRF